MKIGFYIGYVDDVVFLSNEKLKMDIKRFRFKVLKKSENESFCDRALELLGIRMNDMDLKFVNLSEMKYKVVDGAIKDSLKMGTKKIASFPKMKAKHGRCIYIANSGDNYGFSRYKLSISDPDESDDEFYCEEEDMMSCNQFEKIFGFSIPQGYQIVIHLPSLIVEHIDNYWPFKEIKYNVKVVHVDVINGVPVTIKTEAKLDCEFISGNKYFGLHFTKDGLTVLDRQDMTMSDLIKINYYIKNCCDVFNDVKTRIKNINIEHIQRGTVINEDNARS